MSWRLRRESAGSGALGDLGSHAIDQVRYLLGHEVTGVSARTQTFVGRRPGADGVEEVFSNDVKSATTPTEATEQDPWAGEDRVNVLLLGVGALLGWLGAQLSVGLYLRQIEPK